ncbi:NfeD family protein [Rhodococcoides fascians]|uniref:NfeD family protein n=1 Tax=Rhodococcoides fascians TaxID=1828 RepID=UPI000561F16D|nr:MULTISPECIES: NfeD family protein [Rhodococcus]OZF07319.1 hypothetical protein CH301_00870 [Rhodococcus sp. 15-1189-1-1a]OZF22844.1 hypothetical protein CH299_00870 [Rhodococcus sp. 14-2686-1-2]
MLTVFIVCFVVGVVGLVGTFTVGEYSDLGDSHGDGVPFLSLTTIATALFGFGAAGWISALTELPDPIAALVGIAVAAGLVIVTRGLFVPYMIRQQDNSHIGRASYIGLLGTVTLDVTADGWGEVSFADGEGNRVGARAVSSGKVALPRGVTVYIADVDDTYLHVVAVDDVVDGR